MMKTKAPHPAVPEKVEARPPLAAKGQTPPTLVSGNGEAARVPAPRTRGSLLGDVGRLYLAPGVLFERMHERNRAAGVVVLLILSYMAVAAGVISTGVIDYEIDVQTQAELARQRVLPPSERNTREDGPGQDKILKGAEFQKVLSRVAMILGRPARLLVGIGVIAGLLFTLVALRGGRPNFRVLAGIAAFASLVELPRMLLQLGLIAELHVSRVDTSAAVFVMGPGTSLEKFLLLRRLDPIDLWYWTLVGLGLWKSHQMSGRGAILAVLLLATLVTLLNLGLDLWAFTDLRDAFTSATEGKAP